MIPMKTCISKVNTAVFLTAAMALSASAAASRVAVRPEQPAGLYPLRDVRLLESPFSEAVQANRQYLLAHDPDRLLAPFRREAGLEPKAQPYGNWESGGLDGHTAGHYLSALSLMIASGADPNGEFRRRLDYMIDELANAQKANGNGYIGGVPRSEETAKAFQTRHASACRTLSGVIGVDGISENATHADDGRLAGSPGGLLIGLYQHRLNLGHPGEARQLI